MEEGGVRDADVRQSLCLICSNTSTPYAGGIPIIDDGIVASGLRQVFRHLLLVPLQDVEDLYESVTQRSLMCHKCSEVVKEVYEIHQQVLKLQVLMQHKVESLGEIIKVNVDDAASEDLDVNMQFRGFVKLNYAEGRLPNAAVRLSSRGKRDVNGRKKERGQEDEEGQDVNDQKVYLDENGDSSEINPKRIKVEPEEMRQELPCIYICPKCECSFSSETEERSVVREEFYNHYLTSHSPVREDDVSIDKEGRKCYKCTMCTFSSPIEEIPGRIQESAQEALEKLMEHFIESHDTCDEDGLETWAGGGDLIKDLDYFKCPEPECSYVVLVSNVNGFQDFKEKSRQAVAKLCNHSIFLHGCQEQMPSASGNSMKHPCFVQISEHHGSFKCPKCEFCLNFNLSGNEERQTALRNFNKHYIAHISDPKREKVPVESIKCPLCPFVTHRDLDVTTVLKYPSEQGQILVRNVNKHFMDMHPNRDIPKFATFRTCVVPYIPPSDASSSSSHIPSSNVDCTPAVEVFEIADLSEDEDNENRATRVANGMKNRKRLHCPECDFTVATKGSLWTEQVEAINNLIVHYTKHILIPSVPVESSSTSTGNGKSIITRRTYMCTLCTTFESKDLYEGDPSAEAVSLRNLAEHYLMEHKTINESSEDDSAEDDDRSKIPKVILATGTGPQSIESNVDTVLRNRNPIVNGSNQNPPTSVVESEPVACSSSHSSGPAQNHQDLQDYQKPKSSAGRRGPGRPAKRRKVLASRYAKKSVPVPVQSGLKRRRGRPRKIPTIVKQEPLDEVDDFSATGSQSIAQENQSSGAQELAASTNQRLRTRNNSHPVNIVRRQSRSRTRSENNSHVPPESLPPRVRRPRQISQMVYPSLVKRMRIARAAKAPPPGREKSAPPPSPARLRRATGSGHEQSGEDVPQAPSTRPQKRLKSSGKRKRRSNKQLSANLPKTPSGFGYQCPKCEYRVEVEGGQSSTKDKSRQNFQRHYIVEHSPVNRKDPIRTDEFGKKLYACSQCNFKSYISENEQRTLAMRKYLARFAVGIHNLKCHEGNNASELVNLSELKSKMAQPQPSTSKSSRKSMYSCPSCTFTADDPSIGSGNSHSLNRRNLVCHFAKHIKYRGVDVVKTSTGTQYFKCPHCDFQSFLKMTPEAECDSHKYAVVRYHARLVVADHVLTVHENMPAFSTSPRPAPSKLATPEQPQPLPSARKSRKPVQLPHSEASNSSTTSGKKNQSCLLEGLDYFKCNDETCSYTVKVIVTTEDPADVRMNSRTALKQLANHCIRSHGSRSEVNEGSYQTQYPCLQHSEDGTNCFKCPQCDFRLPIRDNGVNAGNERILHNGYVMLLLHYTIHLFDTSVDQLPVTKLACSYCSYVEKCNPDYVSRFPSEKAKLLERSMKDHIKQAHNGMPTPVFELFKGIRTRKDHLRSRKSFRKGFSCQYCEYAPEDTGEEIDLIDFLLSHYLQVHPDKTVPLIGPNEDFLISVADGSPDSPDENCGEVAERRESCKASGSNGNTDELTQTEAEKAVTAIDLTKRDNTL